MQDDKLWKELKYDTQNHISQVIKYFDGGSDTTFLVYNTNNQVAEVKRWKNIVDKYVYENGRLTKMLSTNIQNPEWNVKLIYFYKNDRIDYADKYVNDKLISKIYFGYNKNGNTTSRKEYAIGSSQDFAMEEYRCSYDDKINPFHDLNNYPIDILQTNNVSTTYFFAIYLNSIAQEYKIDYQYDKDGCPISAKKYNVKYPDKIFSTYTYIYK